jgi:hypothetical protein
MYINGRKYSRMFIIVKIFIFFLNRKNIVQVDRQIGILTTKKKFSISFPDFVVCFLFSSRLFVCADL